MGRKPKNSVNMGASDKDAPVSEKSLNKTISDALKVSSDLEKFKKSKFLDTGIKMKNPSWIPFSPALQNALQVPGLPMGHISLARGHSDTGKTTILIEAAIGAQKLGILPVFIMTEMKWDFSHARTMGFELEEVKDESGDVVDYKGFFIYADRNSLKSVEGVASFILDLLDEQAKGKLPYNLLFLWDSIGSIPCNMSIEKNNNNPMWNAGAMATQFGNFVNHQILMSRKITYPYTNTLFAVNKVGVQPAEGPMAQPRMTNKGGNAMFWDATMVITFGNVTNSGTSKLKAVKDKKNVEFAKRTKVGVEKFHTLGGITTRSTVVVTPHGFIEDTDSAINNYKKANSSKWFEGAEDAKIEEDSSEWFENSKTFSPLVDVEENG